MLIFPSACEGAGGDIHGVQHDLHRAMRIPQAVTTAWSATPPCPHAGGSMKLLFHMIGRLWRPSDLSTLASKQNGCRSLEKISFSARYTSHSPFPPLPCTYILANTILRNTYSWTLRPFVLVIVLSMTVYSEAFDCGQCVNTSMERLIKRAFWCE